MILKQGKWQNLGTPLGRTIDLLNKLHTYNSFLGSKSYWIKCILFTACLSYWETRWPLVGLVLQAYWRNRSFASDIFPLLLTPLKRRWECLQNITPYFISKYLGNMGLEKYLGSFRFAHWDFTTGEQNIICHFLPALKMVAGFDAVFRLETENDALVISTKKFILLLLQRYYVAKLQDIVYFLW